MVRYNNYYGGSDPGPDGGSDNKTNPGPEKIFTVGKMIEIPATKLAELMENMDANGSQIGREYPVIKHHEQPEAPGFEIPVSAYDLVTLAVNFSQTEEYKDEAQRLNNWKIIVEKHGTDKGIPGERFSTDTHISSWGSYFLDKKEPDTSDMKKKLVAASGNAESLVQTLAKVTSSDTNPAGGGGARRRSSGRKGRRSKRRSSGRRPRRSKRRSSGKKRRHRKGSCANKRKSRSCRNSKRCTWAKGRKGSRGHCRRSKNRK